MATVAGLAHVRPFRAHFSAARLPLAAVWTSSQQVVVVSAARRAARLPPRVSGYCSVVPNPLFSSYRAGENRVTSSTLAVFERIDLALMQELLATATSAGAELTTVTFDNQVVGDASVPDARISARFTWWFETKTTRGGYAGRGPRSCPGATALHTVSG